LLLEAQADMRWTTSPRLSLELALVRATMPETDPEPAGLIARLERLERLAGVDSTTPRAGEDAPAVPDAEPNAAPAAGGETSRSSSRSKPTAKDRPQDEVVVVPDVAPDAPTSPPRGSAPGPAPSTTSSAPTTSAVDVEMLRRSWPTFIDHLQQQRQPILKALLESATPVGYDAEVLELAFPPDRTFGVTKVEERTPELRAALEAVFGVSPQVRCVVRDQAARAAEPELDDEPTPTEEEALRRIREELGAEIATQPEVEA
jgi:DNA polymerase-3 subunit gamma/tau